MEISKSESTALNNMRGIAAIHVVFSHTGLMSMVFGQMTIWVNEFFSPVRIFFLISGFLIPISITKYGIKHFFISRVFRLLPVMLFIDLLKFANPKTILISSSVMFNFLCTIPVSHVYWSLEIEYFFYFFFAVSYLIHRKLNVYNILITIAIMLLLYFTSAVFNLTNFKIIFSHYLNSITFILAGSMLYLYRTSKMKYLYSIIIVILASVFVIIFPQGKFEPNIQAALSKIYVIFLYNNWGPEVKWWILENFAIIAFLFGYKFLRFESKILLFLANISYPLYLIHLHILSFVAKLSDGYFGKIIAILLSIICAYMIHIFIEKRFIQYGKKLANNLSRS